MTHFLDLMRARQLVAQATHPDELYAHLESPKTAYIGFDPSASSLHVGHMLQIMTLRRWQRSGHRAIALLGGGTVMVGDPTGKSEMRRMLSREDIDRNSIKIKRQLSAFIDLSDPAKGLLVNNVDWLLRLEYLPFLRDIGPHFSVNRMLTAECFKQRLEKGLSFLEFNYMLLQSYDFLHLYRTEGCTVQMGGDDQWSNILGGMELIRRLEDGGQAYCLTTPLLTTSDGRKMGKTESGAVWLDPELTSPYDYYQYWRNVEDDVVIKCLLYFTELPGADIDRFAGLSGAELNPAKEILALECTSLLHGESEGRKAQAMAKSLFGGGGVSAPEVQIGAKIFGESMNIIELLVHSKILGSKAEARRLIQQGGLQVNGKKIEDIKHIVSATEFPDGACLIRKGKKHYYRLTIS